MDFWEKLQAATRKNNSFLCVGLDPRPGHVPKVFWKEEDPLFAFSLKIIEYTADLVCAYKPNFAFYQALGPEGFNVLRRIIKAIPSEIPVILDAKWGDIGSTAEAYAAVAFDFLGADAVTVNPYLGADSLEPFLVYKDKGLFVLCHTSNPGATDFQTRLVEGKPLYLRVAEWAARLSSRIGLVVGATYPEAVRAVREVAPEAWLLLPGVGAQGGDLEEALAAGLAEPEGRVVVNVSRDVIYAENPRQAAAEYRERINRTREALKGKSTHSPAARLTLSLFDSGCIRFGSFTLASGKTSSIYIDLRPLPSFPQLMRQVIPVYVQLLAPLDFDVIAAIPYAALPFGVLTAMEMNKPLIYPRKEAKTYGIARAIEGEFRPGQCAVVLDDLITTGDSKLRVIEPLEQAGLRVKDIVVLIDREQGGREFLEAKGYRLHSFLRLREMLEILVREGRLSQEEKDRVSAELWGN
ncbi:MAG: orotidine-5'-phosphate decarboxylase [Anaerolineae bacterium]|nr:orotidine-5'-phosphate decarboxylase [Anaerolineae bacterium]MDW8102449.1 orotidine-5'-phosphate decarboxylase [Anaerolineae bacterium]